MKRTLAACALAIIAAITLQAQKPGALRFTAPPPNSYISGPITLIVDYEGSSSEIEDVTFFANGQPDLRTRAALSLRLGRRTRSGGTCVPCRGALKSGGRVVVNLRTKAVGVRADRIGRHRPGQRCGQDGRSFRQRA